MAQRQLLDVSPALDPQKTISRQSSTKRGDTLRGGGDNLSRLMKIKAQVDPRNIFKHAVSCG
jgi:FAD/FMN-containing dehydrogenase